MHRRKLETFQLEHDFVSAPYQDSQNHLTMERLTETMESEKG